MIVKLRPIKQLFSNSSNGYRVISCIPIVDFGENPANIYPELVLNDYGNFTLNGSNLSNITIGEEYELEIREDKRSKYSASYIMVCWAGIDINEDIKIAPEQEVPFLHQFMELIQAKRINEAYPNFVQLILDGKENEINYKKIYNVGAVRFEKYVNDVKAHFHSLKYLPVVKDWEAIDNDKLENLIKIFASPEELQEALDTNPFHVFFDLLHFPFAKTDRIVLDKRPDLRKSSERCEFGCMEILRQNELEGDTRIDADLLVEMTEELIPECVDYLEKTIKNSDKIHYDEDTEYTSYETTYNNEKLIAKELLDRINNPEDMGMDWTQFTTIDGFECTEEQAKILELANKHKAVMLRGYSGTGKSTVMKAMVLMLEHYYKDYVQLAPTGKAAARLRETTGRPASTIHMYLAKHEGKDDAYGSPDVFIIDEMSMVGVELLANLLSITNKDTRLIFVCDEAQLASISCGNVVQDIIDSNIMPTANLTKVFRYGSSGLATIATDTRNGHIGPRNNQSNFTDYKFIEGNEPVNQIVDLYGELLDQGYSKDDILVLCPFNKGKYGTYKINQEIQRRFNNHKSDIASYEIKGQTTIEFKVGDKVINTKNEYRMPSFTYDEDGSMVESTQEIPVMNGDIGYVRYIKQTDGGAVMAVEFESGLACVRGSAISELLLGYCITIHKSQGSQAKVVIVFTNKMHKRMLTRNLLYVGDSRAREMLIEIGDIEAIEEGLKKEENKDRDTYLKDLLKNLYK